jgi:hypothetical protein
MPVTSLVGSAREWTLMDELDRLLGEHRTRASSPVASKANVLTLNNSARGVLSAWHVE